jgi:hypothetical protein
LLSSFRPLTGWGLHRFVWKFQREQLRGRPIKCYHFQPTCFIIDQYIDPLKNFGRTYMCLLTFLPGEDFNAEGLKPCALKKNPVCPVCSKKCLIAGVLLQK